MSAAKRLTLRLEFERHAALKQWAEARRCSIAQALDFAVALLIGPDPEAGPLHAAAVEQIFREIVKRQREATEPERRKRREQRALRNQQICADYSSGETLEALAKRYGMSKQAVHQIVQKQGGSPHLPI